MRRLIGLAAFVASVSGAVWYALQGGDSEIGLAVVSMGISPAVGALGAAALQAVGNTLASKNFGDQEHQSFADVEAPLQDVVSPVNNLARFIQGINISGTDIFGEITKPVNFRTRLQTPASVDVAGGLGPAGFFSLGTGGAKNRVVATRDRRQGSKLPALDFTNPFDRSVAFEDGGNGGGPFDPDRPDTPISASIDPGRFNALGQVQQGQVSSSDKALQLLTTLLQQGVAAPSRRRRV